MAFAGLAADLVQRESVGSLTMFIANFSSVSSSLWIGGVPNAVAYWAVGNSVSCAVSTGMASASASAASSGVYFYMTAGGAGDAEPVKLYVLSRC